MNKSLEPLLEEKLEYSTVTALRDSLLRILPALRKRPALRYLITKHGKPEAVLMSFPTYEAFKAVVKYAWEQESAKDRDTSIRDALARMRADHGAQRLTGSTTAPQAPASSAAARQAVKSALGAILEDVRRLDDLLEEKPGSEEPPASTPLAQAE
jgi:hypothetical protein